jgi:hypothetical protein
MNDAENPDGLIAQLNADCQLLKSLIADLAAGHGRVADITHAIRQHGKILRGGLILASIDKERVRDLRRIARILAAPRDAVTCLNAWRRLDAPAEDADYQVIDDLLVLQTRITARKPPASCAAWCEQRLDVLAAALSAASLNHKDERMFRKAHKLERRVHRSAKGLAKGTSDAFHDCRKRCKAWLGAARYLGLAGEETTTCKKLAHILGDENDLATLTDWLEAHGLALDDDHPIKNRILSQRALLRQASRDAARMFCENRKPAEPRSLTVTG